MGKGSSTPSVNLRPSPLEQTQEGIARQLFTESTPLRTGLMASIQDIFGMPRTMEPSTATYIPKGKGVKEAGFRYTPIQGGMKINPFGIYGGARENLEAQYPVARENILSTIPNRGGQLNQNLFNLEQTRAREVGGLKERVINNALNTATGVAFGRPAVLDMPDRDAARQSMEAQIQMANAQAGGQKKAGTVGGIGQVLGSAAGGIFGRGGLLGRA